MDQREAIAIANRYAHAIRSKFDPARVILFGSYARGNYHEESDIDIAVILKDFHKLNEMQLELMRIRRTIDSRIEPHPFREREFNTTNPVVTEIMHYGREIDKPVNPDTSSTL